MNEIVLKSMHLENFKCHKDFSITFGEKETKVYGQNFAGKSSIADAFFWLCFGKSSTGKSEGREFRVRPYDENGVDIDHIDVMVEAELTHNGKPISLRKVQRQKWVRRRGATEQVHTGDENLFFWNEVEILATEFSGRIADMVDEDTFRLVTRPTDFMSRKKDERRDLLMSLVSGYTEEEIAIQVDGFDQLKDMIERGSKVNEIEATTRKSITLAKQNKERMVAAINERSRDILQFDLSEENKRLVDLSDKLEEKERLLDDSTFIDENDKLADEVMALKMEANEMWRKAHEGVQEQARNLNRELAHAQNLKLEKTFALKKSNGELESMVETAKRIDEEKASVKARYTDVSHTEFCDEYEPLPEVDVSSLKCPTCGQELPEDKKKEAIAARQKHEAVHKAEHERSKAAFEAMKKADMKELTDRGKELKEKGTEIRLQYKNEVEANKKLSAELEDVLKKIDNIEKQLSSMPEVDMNSSEEYRDLLKTISEKERMVACNREHYAEYKASLRMDCQKIILEMEAIKEKFKAAEKSTAAKKRVEELNAELKATEQRIADLECVQIECEQFQLAKDDFLTEKVNEKFDSVRFQLYRTQKNGGTERVCDVYVKSGSPYGDNTTSSSEKLIAGLEIIKVISEIVGVKAPVFVDNAECICDYNIPNMDCQAVFLSVSADDKQLRVEV